MALRLYPLREALLITGSLALLGLAVYLDRRADTPVKVGDLRNPHASARNPLDARASLDLNVKVGNIADVGLYGGPALSLLLLAGLAARGQLDRVQPTSVLVVWLETILLNFSLTSVIKNLANRPRPYVMHHGFPAGQVLVRNDRAAFLSGHTSTAMAGSLLFAKIVTHYFSARAAIIPAYLVAGGLPGLTACLRVKSGKHWPTDTLAGLLLGAAVSAGVFALHLPEDRTVNHHRSGRAAVV